VEKYGRAEQATDHNIKRGMRIAYWITKATYTHSEYVILLLDGNSGSANALQYCFCACIACLVHFVGETLY